MTARLTAQVHEIFIRSTPEQVWQAITDPALSCQYFFGTRIDSDFLPLSPFAYTFADGQPCVEGVILEVSAPHRLVHSWHILYDPALSRERSDVSWLIERRGQASKLTVVHELKNAPFTAAHVGTEGWSVVLSGLKTLLETGQPLIVEPKPAPNSWPAPLKKA